MGCWAAPFSTSQAEKVRLLMTKPLVAKNAEHELYHLVGDDTLFEYIDDRLAYDDTTDVRPIVMGFLQDWFGARGDDKDIRDSWGWKEPFEQGALDIFKEMLTNWEEHQSYPD